MLRRTFPPLVPEPKCLNCQYDLRDDVQCPECGLEVRVSLQGDGLTGQLLINTSRSIAKLLCISFGRSIAAVGLVAGLAFQSTFIVHIAVAAFVVLTLTRVWIAARLCVQLVPKSKLRVHRRHCRVMLAAEIVRGLVATLTGLALLTSVFSADPNALEAVLNGPLIIIVPATEAICHLPSEALFMSLAQRIGADRYSRNRLLCVMAEGVLVIVLCLLFGVGPLVAMLLHLSISFDLALKFDRRATRERSASASR
ncbi:MAG: hypothetical protein K2W85_11590 [Phycisphaerales bacterium]|nr:hypothetical protein [Phycisphaerales bacterium]